MKLKINSKENKKLLQNFPNDPYSDLTIITKSSKLRLATAYLSIDSEFFANLSPSCKQIDLTMLSEAPLVAVLRSLYGGQLQANTILELEEFYKIIEALAIQEYKESLVEAIKVNHVENKEASLFNSIEMLQFCMKNELLVEEVSNYHFQNKLKILESSKNYLQLGKLSQKSLNYLLLTFHQKEQEKGDAIINHILENYFNRKNYKPAEYLVKEELSALREIWEKFHHKILPSRQPVEKIHTMGKHMSSSMLNSESTCYTPLKLSKHFASTNLYQTDMLMRSEKISEDYILDVKIHTLSKQSEAKSKKIEALRQQLKNLKKLDKEQESDEQFSELTLLKSVKKSKKEKQELLSHQQSTSIEPAYENAKKVLLEPGKDSGTKMKLSSKGGVSKKIFT